MSLLFRPISISSLCFFRVIFGLLGLVHVIRVYRYQHWNQGVYQPDGFRFKYYGWEWVEPVAEPWFGLLFLIIALAAVGVIMGWRYKLSAAVFALGFAYTFLLERAYYLNHGYLFCVLSFVMVFLPAHRNYSLDAWQGSVVRLAKIPQWPVFLLCFMMGVVYFYGGIAKINADWLQGTPLKLLLKTKTGHPIFGELLEQDWLPYFMSYGGLLFDLTVPFFMLWSLTRKWAFACVLFFHFSNTLILSIGIFPWLSIALTAMYFPADFPDNMFRWLGSKMRWLGRIIMRWNTAWSEVPLTERREEWFLRPQLGKVLVVYCLVHLLIPLRHHLFPGDVTWNEEGHFYSWRMMLRLKIGTGYFMVHDTLAGRSEKVYPGQYLSKRQARIISGQPDMILQFAHFLRDKYIRQGWNEPQVYAHIKVSLNGRHYQPFTDTLQDLAHMQWEPFRSTKWIVPERNEPGTR